MEDNFKIYLNLNFVVSHSSIASRSLNHMIGIFDSLAFQRYTIHQISPNNYQKPKYLSILQLKMAKMFIPEAFMHHKIHPYLTGKLVLK